GAAAHLADILAEVADGGASIDGDLAAVRLLLLHDQPEDGGLARPVGPDQPHVLAAVHGRGGFEEEDLSTVLLADRIEADHPRSLARPQRRPGSSVVIGGFDGLRLGGSTMARRIMAPPYAIATVPPWNAWPCTPPSTPKVKMSHAV